MTSTECRSLPVYPAGAFEVPFVITGMDELVHHDTHWNEHSHPTHELLWNERGASSVTVDSRTWTVTPALGLWIPAGTRHSASATAGTWYRAAQLGIRSVASISTVPVAVEVTPLLRLLLDRLTADDLSASSRSLTEAMVIDLLVPSPRELLVHVPRSALLRPIVAAVLAEPGDGRTLAAWALLVGVSSRTLTRAFRAETGLGFSRWVAAVRAQRAAALLARGDDLVEVAEQLGYRSPSAFGVAFRRTTGMTPGAFRAA